ncbi:MAG TPA: ATP-binding protein [Vicinamibacteria bacterium]|nr:ATP-binding protein [Vicinamibacteria bacterium]
MTYRSRELSGLAGDALDTMPAVVITGPRQSGKTTFLQNDPLFRGRRFLSLDDFAVLEAARRDPDGLVSGDEPLTIDEAQRCPELFVAVKRAVDRERRAGQFVLSGSANLTLLSAVTESLAGRAIYLKLTPFTRREARRGVARKSYLESLLEGRVLRRPFSDELVTDRDVLEGGMPSVVTGETSDPRIWFLGYEQTYLERDLRDLAQVADLVAFRTLMRLAALRTGQILNFSDLARDVKLPVSTVARYVGLLETSMILEKVQPYLRSRTTRLIKSPKIYMADSGIASHLASVDDLSADEPLRGALFETYVYQNLSGILSARLPRAELFFWSVQGRHEVDFVLSRGRDVVAVEVKAGSRFDNRDLAGLQAFAKKTSGLRAAVLAYNGTETVKLGERQYAIPMATLLS